MTLRTGWIVSGHSNANIYALRKNLTGPSILAGSLLGVKGTRRRRGCGNVGIPRLLRDFQARWKRWKSRGWTFPRFPRRAIFPAKLWILGIFARMPCLGTAEGLFGHFSKAAPDAHFSRFLRRAGNKVDDSHRYTLLEIPRQSHSSV